MPLVKRTLAILRKAEFGFFGVMVVTLRQTPRFCGLGRLTGMFLSVLNVVSRAGDLLFLVLFFLAFLTNWLIVGTVFKLNGWYIVPSVL